MRKNSMRLFAKNYPADFVKSIPTAMLVKDGQILKHWSGAIDVKELDAAIHEKLSR